MEIILLLPSACNVRSFMEKIKMNKCLQKGDVNVEKEDFSATDGNSL